MEHRFIGGMDQNLWWDESPIRPGFAPLYISVYLSIFYTSKISSVNTLKKSENAEEIGIWRNRGHES